MHASTVSLILRILATVLCAVAIAIALRKPSNPEAGAKSQ